MPGWLRLNACSGCGAPVEQAAETWCGSGSRLATDARNAWRLPCGPGDRTVPELVTQREVNDDERPKHSGECHERQRIVSDIHPAARIRMNDEEHGPEDEDESTRCGDCSEGGKFLESQCARIEHSVRGRSMVASRRCNFRARAWPRGAGADGGAIVRTDAGDESR